MPAYLRCTLSEFLSLSPQYVVGRLEIGHAGDGYATQFATQTRSWLDSIPRIQSSLREVLEQRPSAEQWSILLEYPLYRLRKRIDLAILADSHVVVVELKVGETAFRSQDLRQVEEYALDLRDFHEASRGRALHPVLWCTEATTPAVEQGFATVGVSEVVEAGQDGIAGLLVAPPHGPKTASIAGAEWDMAPYRPVPNVIEAATSIFAGHDVRTIAQADASNLQDAAARLVQLIVTAREQGRKALIFLTGVPGSGKTLAGLQVVHDALASGVGGHVKT